MYQFCHYSNTLRLFAACLLLLLTACTVPSLRQRQQQHLLEQTDSSQQQMIKFINQQTQYLRMEMENKINDPFSAEKARKWQPVASAVHQETSKLMQLIEKLCERLRQGNTEVLFRKDTNAIHLHRYLADYKRKILRLNEGMTAEFGNQIFEEIDTSLSEMKGAASIQAAVAQLSQPETLVWLQQKMLAAVLAENRLLAWCNHQSTRMFCGINVFQPIVTQNSTVLQPGEKLVITAGVGSYSTEAQPEVIIKNDTIKKTNNAVAIYSVAVSKLKGKYSLPVTICYINENGIAVKEVIPISWTVR